MTTTRKLLTTVVALATILLLAALPAGAHTAMLRASPDRDAVAGGAIAFVDLEFLDPVSDATVTVTYNGVPTAGRTTVAAGRVITFTFDQPMTQPGRYQVGYEMVSADGDFTTGGYFFTYDPAAAVPPRIEPIASGGLPTTTIALSAAGLALLGGFVGLSLWRAGRRRARWDVDEYDGYDGYGGYDAHGGYGDEAEYAGYR